MALLFTLYHSNKENDPGAAYQSHRQRSTALNPYVTRKIVPTKSSIAFSQESSQDPSSKPTSTAQINEDSPTIKRILAASGCASVAELLARDQQKANATSGAKAPATNRSRSTTSTNRYKSTTNGSRAATNGSNASNATNVAKARNGSKSTTSRDGSKSTNPKKKAKSKYCYFY